MTTVSLSKLDLSFLKKNDPNGVQAGRFVWDAGVKEFVPASQVYRKRARAAAKKRSNLSSPYFMPDVDAAYGGAWKSIIDGSEISSRTNWREHNKRNGVMQVDPDFWGKTEDSYVSEVKQRMEYRAPAQDGEGVFSWKNPESAKARKNDGKASRRGRRKSA
jgi:hypothetical protein